MHIVWGVVIIGYYIAGKQSKIKGISRKKFSIRHLISHKHLGIPLIDIVSLLNLSTNKIGELAYNGKLKCKNKECNTNIC